jgi:hypothetical protein
LHWGLTVLSWNRNQEGTIVGGAGEEAGRKGARERTGIASGSSRTSAWMEVVVSPLVRGPVASVQRGTGFQSCSLGQGTTLVLADFSSTSGTFSTTANVAPSPHSTHRELS